MTFEYKYTVCFDNSPYVFKETCKLIENLYSNLKKEDLLIDVDGSTIQRFRTGDGKMIVVYDDYDYCEVLIRSNIDLGPEDKFKAD